MSTLYLDLETYSVIPIKHGVHKYCERAIVLLWAYAVDDGPVQLWDAANDPMPPPLACVLGNAHSYTFCAHDSQFDRNVLEATKMLPKGLLWRDTMVRALAHGLPGGLDMLCQIYNIKEDLAKHKEGKKLIHLFCKPNKNGGRNTKQTHPVEWKAFCAYAKNDIIAMRELDKKIPKWNDSVEERALWYLDQKINDRGFAVDLDLANAAIKACSEAKDKRDKRTQEMTGGTVNAASQRDAMLKHMLEEYGVDLPDLQIATLTRRPEDPDLPEPVKELIALRLQSAATSTKKYQVVVDSTCMDGRMRGTLQYCGANRTGRWGGRLFQPQNLPRPKFKHDEIDFGIEALKSGVADLVYDNIVDIASSAIRGIIVAPNGKKLVISDLSAIEGRVLAWLAGEQWKLDAYANGEDLYVLAYAKAFDMDPTDVTKAQRQLGKVLELALGYQGGVGAFLTFARGYNVNLNELTAIKLPKKVQEECEVFYDFAKQKKQTHGLEKDVFIACDGIKRLWRESNPNIAAFWVDLENICKRVITEPNKYLGASRITASKINNWLRMQLPSGRYLCYAGSKIEDGKISYLGINQYSRKWCRLNTYGGKLAENLTQATARDIIAHGMTLAEREGYKVVLHVHDELITEAFDESSFTHEELSKLMSTNPDWAKGLPLDAKGFESYRYRKD